MIRVQAEDFDPGFELEALLRGHSNVGGVATFLGLVRAEKGEAEIRAMTLEHYPGMTEKLLGEIEVEAQARWPLEASLIIHRHGRLVVGERIVYVVTASAHRQAAFEANMFLVDWLKTRAPFWKQEETAAGTRWVEARASDDDAADRWAGRGVDREASRKNAAK